MGIITMSRLLGAGETAIAPAVATELGWKVADQSIVRREAELSGISLPEAVRWDERDPHLLERLHRAGPSIATFIETSRSVMLELAKQGDVIILGRGGNLLLRGVPNTLHVRLIADLPSRIQRVMQARWIDADAARALITACDQNRAAYYRHVFHVDWNDPANYDVVIRTDTTGIDRSVRLIIAAASQQAE